MLKPECETLWGTLETMKVKISQPNTGQQPAQSQTETPERGGGVVIATNIKKTRVFIDKNGNEITLPERGNPELRKRR